MTDKSVLQLYDVKREIWITCGASHYGLGAVLSHVVNGEENLVSLSSRSLSAAEFKYWQIEKETLSIVFAVKKIHKYLHE